MRHTLTSMEVAAMRIAPKIELDAADQRELTALARRGRVEARVQQRARIVLLAAQGWQNKDIASEVDLDRRQVALWRQRFLEGGVQALMHDAPRPGRTPSVTTAEFESSIVDKTLHDRPIAATHWSTRTLAAQLGVGPTTILCSAKSRLYQLTWAFGRPRRRFVGPRIAATRAPPTEPTNTRGAIRPARAVRAHARPAPIDAELRLSVAAPSHEEGPARPVPMRCEGVHRCSARPTPEGSISSAAPIEGSPSPGTRGESFR